MDRKITRLRNALQLDGRVESTNRVYLKDTSGNVILGTDANGRWYGKALTPRSAAVTANDDGLTTAIIPDNVDFVTITSAGATKNVSLPAAAASTVGKELRLFVGSNGLELLSAAGNQTINTVDSDGTNQLDVPANSLVHLIQISATGWYAFIETSTALSVVAPDND